ncbi:MerR family transcriptional regulator [Naasia sp. SYSU D00948]|uniref:MerR family transcriptional regulator n=1 Tax=Naasia sp. SYSU D00948 TaxID=2817379 RepID=UPI001B301A41|nr:MerR family transcriptional regulator [Naasia sp. SYSU D00948]
MRVSELVQRTGTPLATIKYYLREGLLPAGRSTAATQADYTEEHVRRVAVIRALSEVAGLPLAKIRQVLAVIDVPGDDLFAALGTAVGALPPYPREQGDDLPRARAAVERLGMRWDPDYPAAAQLEHALAAAEAAGLPPTGERLDAYGRAIGALAEYDIRAMPHGAGSAVEYAVLGTALYEPVLLALRRIAHQDAARRLLEGSAERPGERPPAG